MAQQTEYHEFFRIRLPQEMFRQIKQEAEAEGSSMNSIIVRMLKQPEPPYDMAELIERMKALVARHSAWHDYAELADELARAVDAVLAARNGIEQQVRADWLRVVKRRLDAISASVSHSV